MQAQTSLSLTAGITAGSMHSCLAVSKWGQQFQEIAAEPSHHAMLPSDVSPGVPVGSCDFRYGQGTTGSLS